MSRPILKLEGLSKAFGAVQVIDDVSFDVPQGTRMALIGPNGAGKTTIFNLMSGVYTPDEGRVIFDGEDITGLPSRKRIGRGLARSFQNIRLMPHLSVVENIMLGQQSRVSGPGAMIAPLGRRSRWRQEAEALLSEMNIDTYTGEVVATLPYGIRKKIEVVRALAAKPKMLMLDEPAAGLNPSETAALRDFLIQISETGTTILIVEHDMSLVRSLCDRAVVLNFGRLIYDGSTRDVQNDPQVLEAYLGSRHAEEAVHA
ncbi:branched-chain amino acid transport ATP-binding protein livG [Pseudooceanicola batsensis HTCC2597]|uniref:Branched-chain amino acid transport ATP-binding protein livG n=1 Tax=Pseudooceanicola batsensis (strain ATCC BAA-863 / DSM 15984 / KCTC 12145 / HTCC2597) TaxID=252305 RepID=A3U0C7_PSEBH|nr:ABC transporter ATP-binding protein [Pseudooceanicola batsensis]EAQ02218.1 branched-chain amino acid transport ATP-binding protein livG [Pseudooceanicola batsensis HTCC2597]